MNANKPIDAIPVAQVLPESNPLKINLNTTDPETIARYYEEEKLKNDRNRRLDMMMEKFNNKYNHNHEKHNHNHEKSKKGELEVVRARILDIIELDRLSPDQKLTESELKYLKEQVEKVKKEIDDAKLQEMIFKNDENLEKAQTETEEKYDKIINEAIRTLSIKKFNNTSEKKIMNPLKKLIEDFNNAVYNFGTIINTGDLIRYFKEQIKIIEQEMTKDDTKEVLASKDKIDDIISSLKNKLDILGKKSTNPFMLDVDDNTKDAAEKTIFIPKDAFDQLIHDFQLFLEKLFGLDYKTDEIIQKIKNQVSEISSIFGSLDSTPEDNIKIARMLEIYSALCENIQGFETEINTYLIRDKKYQEFLNTIKEYSTQIKEEIYDVENPKYGIYNMLIVEAQPFLKKGSPIDNQRLSSIGGILYSIIINDGKYSKNGSNIFYPDKIFQEIYKISKKNNQEITPELIQGICNTEIKKLTNEMKSDKTKEDGNIKKINILRKMIEKSTLFVEICNGGNNIPKEFDKLYLPQNAEEYDQYFRKLYTAQDEKIKKVNRDAFLSYTTKIDGLIDGIGDKYNEKINNIDFAIRRLRLLISNPESDSIIAEKIKEYKSAIENLKKEKEKKIADTQEYFYVSEEQKKEREEEIAKKQKEDKTNRPESVVNKYCEELFRNIISRLNGINGPDKPKEKKQSRSTNPENPLDLSAFINNNRNEINENTLRQPKLAKQNPENIEPVDYRSSHQKNNDNLNINSLSSLQTGFNNQAEMNQQNPNTMDVEKNHLQEVY